MPPTTLTAKLGNHDVGRIGFGAMQLAGPGVFGPPRDRDGAIAVLRRAVELGVDHIDTSQYYGPDVVNALIRDALHPYPDGLRLVTKVGARRDDQGAWLPALRPDELRAGVEDNLRTLGVEELTLDDLRREGKLELIGLSNATRALVEEALELVPIAGVQNQYSVLDRSNEDVLEACCERGLAFVPFFPLGSAFTGGPAKLAEDAAIAQVSAKQGATPSQVALAWLLHRDERILLIPGTSSVTHLEENLAAADVELDAEDMTALEDVEPAGNPLEAVHD
jgi:aryl-alcohol dehydrogenase-like predicted oxidoreductase